MITVGFSGAPVIHRELQVTGRDPALYKYRTIVAALAILVAVLCISFLSSTPASAGRSMFNVFTWGGLLLCLLEGGRSGADAISGERRQGTLGLLFLTDLRPRDVVLGKLMFVSIRSLALLLPLLPMFALPLLLGGVTHGESWRAMLTLLLTLLFALSAGLFMSSLSVDSIGAFAKTTLLLMLLAVPPSLSLLVGRPPWPLPATWTSGPLGMMVASRDASFASGPASFCLAGLFSIILSVFMLAAASYFTHRNVSMVPISTKAQWWHRWLKPQRGYVPPWGENVDQSPAIWLAQRTLPGQRLLWALIGLGLGTCFLSGLLGSVLVAVGIQILFGVMLKLWMVIVAPQSLHDLRKSGVLESILCTPLQPQGIVRGQIDLLYEAFIGPALAIAVGLPAALCGGGVLAQRGEIAEAAVMVPVGMIWLMYTLLDLHALGYLGMWHGLSSNRIESAIGKTAWYGVILPLLFVVVPILGWIALLFWPGIVISWASKRLTHRFHEPLTRS